MTGSLAMTGIESRSTLVRRIKTAQPRARRHVAWDDIIPRPGLSLADSKTGPHIVPLGGATRRVLNKLAKNRHPGADDGFLFPRYARTRSPHDIAVCWRVVCEDAGLGKLRLHDLRHTFASQAVMSGKNLPLVGRLLEHRRHTTTAHYAHPADDHLVEAAERVGRLAAEAMRLKADMPTE